MVTVTFPVSGMTCAACSSRVQRALEREQGVDNAHVVTPDDIWRSMLYQRVDTLTSGIKMPPLDRNLIDTNAVAVMGACTPVSMLLVRCQDGISHHPDESVVTGDIQTAIAVLHDFLLMLGNQLNPLLARKRG